MLLCILYWIIMLTYINLNNINYVIDIRDFKAFSNVLLFTAKLL